MAIVKSRELAIIRNSPVLVRVVVGIPQTLSAPGSGPKPGNNGGPPEARLGYRGLRSMGRDEPYVGRRTTGGREKWRADVGPMLSGAGPRPLRFGLVRGHSLEGLVFAEVRDGQSERIDGDEFVGNSGLEDKDEIRRVEVPLDLGAVSGRVVHHIEIDTGLERCCLHVFEGYFLHVNVDLRSRGVCDELLNDLVFFVSVENAIRQLSVEEVEGLREVVLDCVAVAPVVERAKLGKEILCLGILGLVFKIVVVDRFCATQVINPNYERTEVLECADRP